MKLIKEQIEIAELVGFAAAYQIWLSSLTPEDLKELKKHQADRDKKIKLAREERIKRLQEAK